MWFYMKDQVEQGDYEFEKLILRLSQKIYDLDNTYWAEIFEKGMREVQTHRNTSKFKNKVFNNSS